MTEKRFIVETLVDALAEEFLLSGIPAEVLVHFPSRAATALLDMRQGLIKAFDGSRGSAAFDCEANRLLKVALAVPEIAPHWSHLENLLRAARAVAKAIE